MIRYFSNIDKALDFMGKTMAYSPEKLYLSWTRFGRNKAEFRVSTSIHVFKNSAYTLYETERKMIVKNVKQFKFFRQWTKTK